MGGIVLLCGSGPSGRWVYHALRAVLQQRVVAVRERPQSRARLLWRRARRLGIATAFGQALFSILVPRLLKAQSRAQIKELKQRYALLEQSMDSCIEVDSVNSVACRNALQELQPELVVVVGTRIIGKETLAALSCPLVNIHAGITPAYRGVHGAYWALVEGRPDLVGTTVHRVDAGIDTGEVLGQVVFETSRSDNFVTYPLLHFGHGIPLLLTVVKKLLSGCHEPFRPLASNSSLRYHPTIWSYLYHGVFRGVW